MYVHRANIPGDSPEKQRIPCKNKIKNTSDTSINRKKSIQVPENQSKREK